MRPLSPAAKAALADNHRAWCVRVQRLDGAVQGYTSHDRVISIAGVDYRPQSGIIPSNYRSDLKAEAASSEFTGFFDDAEISEQDILRGVLDGAIVTVFVCSWLSPPTAIDNSTCLILSVGGLGKARWTNRQFTLEMLSRETKFQQDLRKTTQPTCRATLGDAACGKAISPYRWRGAVSAIAQNLDITASVVSQGGSAQPTNNGYYTNGRVLWITGANTGNRGKIRTHAGGALSLLAEPFFPIAVGDEFWCDVGCNKSLSECNTKFSNHLNFRGEPFIPGPNALTRSPS